MFYEFSVVLLYHKFTSPCPSSPPGVCARTLVKVIRSGTIPAFAQPCASCVCTSVCVCVRTHPNGRAPRSSLACLLSIACLNVCASARLLHACAVRPLQVHLSWTLVCVRVCSHRCKRWFVFARLLSPQPTRVRVCVRASRRE